MTITDEARAALDAKRDAERQLATVAVYPPWRHAIFGLLMGAFVATPAVALPLRLALVAVMLVSLPLIILSDRKRTGMFVNGYRRGKTRTVTFAILAIEMGLYAIAVWRSTEAHDHVTPFLLGAVGGVVAIVGSLIWQRVFVRELGA